MLGFIMLFQTFNFLELDWKPAFRVPKCYYYTNLQNENEDGSYLFQIVARGVAKKYKLIVDAINKIFFYLANKIIVGRTLVCMPQDILQKMRRILFQKHFVALFENLKHVEIQTLVENLFFNLLVELVINFFVSDGLDHFAPSSAAT
jgi:hypothetical protein